MSVLRARAIYRGCDRNGRIWMEGDQMKNTKKLMMCDGEPTFSMECPVCKVSWEKHPGAIALCHELHTVKSANKLHFDWKLTKGGDTNMAKKIVKKSLPKPPAKATKKVVKAKAKPVAKKKK